MPRRNPSRSPDPCGGISRGGRVSSSISMAAVAGWRLVEWWRMASGGEFGSGEPGTGGEAAAAHGPGVGGNRFGRSARSGLEPLRDLGTG
jgi:hypothetical protein